jgi:hypothetical protein
MCVLRVWCCSNGPDALKKYSGDQEVVEAAMEAGDIIQQVQQEQQQVRTHWLSHKSVNSSAAKMCCHVQGEKHIAQRTHVHGLMRPPLRPRTA